MMGPPLGTSVLLALAAVFLVATPPSAEASSRHLHRHLHSVTPRENDFFFTNVSQLNPNVTANLIYGCWYKPINFTQYENKVEQLVSAFYQRLLNGTIGGNVTVVRLADGSLNIINGNVSVSPTGQLIVNGVLTGTGVYNGTLKLNQTLGLLPNLTSLVPQVFQQIANATAGGSSTLGGIIGGLLGSLPPVPSGIPGLNTSSFPSINYNPSMLGNTSQLLSYSPVTPEAILAYMQNLTAAALAAVNGGLPAADVVAGSELNRAVTVATPAPTRLGAAPNASANATANATVPGFPVIKVYFFVIVATSADNDVTQTMLINQIAKMNADYGVGTPFKFTLAGAVKIVNPEWVGRDVDTEEDVFNEMKSRTRIGGPQDLNVWILEFSDDGLNGYATFPWDFTDDPYIDGVVISKYTLPMERTNRNYQELRSVGITLTHETGHWLGLFHTFQGGCIGSGDYVADTVPEGTPNDYNDPACDTPKFSCPQLGRNQPADPIFNFMDYGACRRLFTPGQATRLRQYWTYYRYNQG